MSTLVYQNCDCTFNINDGQEGEIFCKDPRVDLPSGPIDLNIYEIPLNCPSAWGLYEQGYNVGLFQLEKQLGKQWMQKVKPKNIEELSGLISILRPGCISGDTNIILGFYDAFDDTNIRKNKIIRHMKIRELYRRYTQTHWFNSYKKAMSIKTVKINHLISLNETNNLLFNNNIKDIIYSGQQAVFRPYFNIRLHSGAHTKYYNLECTSDHLLLTHDDGWKKLCDIKIGERIAIINSLKTNKRQTKYITGRFHFRDICFQNYQYRCVLCDWKEASLDVNHIDGNRHSNNDIDNLCFLCPNHHRMFSENKISKEEIIEKHKQFRLINTKHIIWGEYAGFESCGTKDTYDIQVEGPHHNFVAGNVIVHNCLKAMSGEPPKSMAQRYVDRKDGKELTDDFGVPELREILYDSLIIPIYQEHAIRIASEIAGFTEAEADLLRRAIGKKKPEEMASLADSFINGCLRIGKINKEKAEEIFGWIIESQKYSFNKSHATEYAKNSYWSAYCKAHFPLQFYCSYLKNSQYKQDKYQEVYEIINEARLLDISINLPDFRDLKEHFYIKKCNIYFGLTNIKQVGTASFSKLIEKTQEIEQSIQCPVSEWTWIDFLYYLSPFIPQPTSIALISSGALDYFGKSRNEMLYNLDFWNNILTEKEREWIKLRNLNSTLLQNIKECAATKKKGGGCSSYKRVNILLDVVRSLENPPYSLEDSLDFIAWAEEEYLGISITCSKVEAKPDSTKANCTCKDIFNGMNGYLVLAAQVDRVNEIITKNKRKMAFLTLSDNTCALSDCVCFPDQWLQYKGLLREGNVVLIRGSRSKRSNFVCEKVFQI